MKTVNSLGLTFTLLLVLLILAGNSCLPQPVSPPPSPPSPQQELPPPDTTTPQTVITVAPAAAISSNKVTFEWTGSDDRTPTNKLTYSYYLEGHDSGYSSFTADTSKTYTNLPNGTYTFYVKSHDEADNVDLTPASVKFTVATPKPEEKTETVTPTVSTLLIVPNSDVSHIAVGYDNTIYALDSPHARLYKSDHGGYGWTDISRGLGGVAPWTELAIAPDNPRIVAVVTNAGTEVFLSTDGGTNFAATGLSGKLGGSERVECLAISPGYGSRDIAVGTSTGNGNGRVWVNIVDGFPSGWQDMSTSATGWSNADIFAIEYSTGFAADGTILAIAATGPPPSTDNTYLYIGTKDLGGNTTTWNNASGYPVQISQSGQDTPGTPLIYADIALPADYIGTSPASRHVYACWSDNPPGVATSGNPNDDVYRLDDTVCYRLLVRTDVICSLAHYGMFSRGKLLAGAVKVSTVSLFHGPQVYFTSNPHSPYPTWQNSQKPPTGPAQARVGWSADGRVAYCGTSAPAGGSGDQSAFSVSTNNGFTWNQIGLIDL
ncbi:MAG: triple tyrosine motif-containing protein [Dehalococcoidia bacterium]